MEDEQINFANTFKAINMDENIFEDCFPLGVSRSDEDDDFYFRARKEENDIYAQHLALHSNLILLENKKNELKNLNTNNGSNNSLLKKREIFKAMNSCVKDEQKQKKLLRNRISAKKSRMKKKNYILKLEEELAKLKKEIKEKMKKKRIMSKKTSTTSEEQNQNYQDYLQEVNYFYFLFNFSLIIRKIKFLLQKSQ